MSTLRNPFAVTPGGFTLDGKPFRLIGGAIHYFRVPREYWKDRLLKLIELGCNTVETYVAWNAHEPYKNQLDFSGNLDIVAFVELAQSLGQHVIVRPGPYICAEWDFGGLPWWLLAEDDLAIRCADPAYLRHVEDFYRELLPRLLPLLSTLGGPIIAMQIENEYGYFGNDSVYLKYLRDLMVRSGVNVPLFTSDGTYQNLTIHNGGIDGILRTANFGSDPATRFNVLRKYQKDGPLVCMEFWVGWFDTWGDVAHASRDPKEAAKNLDDLLAADAHANIYMFHGGTNFGFTAGGNLTEQAYKPFVTSYDYDALLSESGDITPKYAACREVIHKHLGQSPAPTKVEPIAKKAFGRVELNESIPLIDALPMLGKPIRHVRPRPMEKLGHGNGYVLYQTTLDSRYKGEKLVIRGMHDWAHVMLDGRTLATWYRNLPMPEMILDFPGETVSLEILVHNLGRSNFGHLMAERKGITEGVFVGPHRHEERALFHWTHYPLPLNDLKPLDFEKSKETGGPRFFRGTFDVDHPADTFLKLPGFCFGCAFVNGVNLGRFWKIGPQRTLYVPAPMLQRGANELIVFEASGLEGDAAAELVDRSELG